MAIRYDELIPRLKRLLPAHLLGRIARDVHFIERLRAIRCAYRPCRSAIPADADHPFRRKAITRADAAGWVYFAGFWALVKLAFTFLMDSPPSLRRWALWTRRSQTASAIVSSPMTGCQSLGSSWLVMTVDETP
jgi:hypothetical protein